MKIRAVFKRNDKINGYHQKDFRIFGIFARIRIYNPHHDSDEVYATTIHELAHASHWELRRNKWNFEQTSGKVVESWARGVQWELTRMKYPNYRVYENRPNYTLVIKDLIDDDRYYGNFDSYGEFVTGYTIKQIENVLDETSTWEDLKNNLKNNYDNKTEKYLDKLFNYW